MVTHSARLIATSEVPEAVDHAIRELLRRQLEKFGVDDVRVEPGEDHDGDPVILVHVKHRLVDRPIDLKSLLVVDRKARDIAWANGERRFVHVRHEFDENQRVADDK
jgi:hypothetical protein